MRTIRLYVILCLSCVILASAAFADSIDNERELERMSVHAVAAGLQVFEDKMEMRAVTKEAKKTWSADTEQKRKKRLFCRGFLSDVKMKRDIEIIEPLYRTDDFNDPKLQEYLRACPNLELNLSVYPQQPDIKNPEMWNSFTYEKKKELGSVFVWAKGFRLYEIPATNRRVYVLRVTDGYKTYRYTADSPVFKKFREKEAQTPPKPITSWVDYRVFTLDTCRDYDWIDVEGEWDYRHNRPRNCSNGILKYKGRHYVYEMCDEPSYGHNIRLIDLEIHEKREDDLSYPYEWACSLSGKEDR